MDLERRGKAALDLIPADDAGTVTVEAAARALRPGTRVLTVSSAQYATGAVTDLRGLGRLCRERGVLLCVDGIQTVGALPLDVKAAGVHFLSADSHKWMLGMMGIGAVFVDRSVVKRIHLPLLGWRSTTDNFNFDRVHFELPGDAGRFEEGSLAYPLIAGFSAALDLLEEAGVERIAAHMCGLVADLAARLERLGGEISPGAEHRRHILTFSHPDVAGEALEEGLAAAGVVVSLRRGRIRGLPAPLQHFRRNGTGGGCGARPAAAPPPRFTPGSQPRRNPMNRSMIRPFAPALAGALALAWTTNDMEAQRPQEDGAPPAIEEKTAAMDRMDGFFPIYREESAGRIWLEIGLWDTDVLHASGVGAGLGSNDIGIDRGQQAGSRVVRFHRVGPKVLMIQPNYRFRASSDNPAERRAVEDAFAPSTLWGFTVGAETGDRVLVDFTPFLLQDVANFAGRLRPGTYRLDASRSAVHMPMTMNFTENTEMEASLTFVQQAGGGGGGFGGFGGGGGAFEGVGNVAASGAAATIRVHHSLIRLPELGGYTPRVHNSRAGYGGMSFQDYSVPLGEPMTQRFIRRHRLEKRDPGAAMSEPVEPIVYYLDPGTPEPVRSALLDGARWWNQAFEAAGFIDAFRVELRPEDVSSHDVRYNVINWVHRSTRGWSTGGSITDPRTGEILKGTVTLGSLRVRQDYLIAEGLLAPYEDGDEMPSEVADWALARVRQLSAHEVGHTLGLSHNYYDSDAGRISVLDYPHPLITHDGEDFDYSEVYDADIGEWDRVAIRYGYSHFRPGTDEAAELERILNEAWEDDIRFFTNQDISAHARADQWSNGTDAGAELNRMLDVRRAALERFGERVIRAGRPMAQMEEVLVPLYLHHRYQVAAAASVLGGMHYTYATRGDGHDPVRAAPAAEQQRALGALVRALEPAELTIPESVLDDLPPRPSGYGGSRELFPRYTGSMFDAISPAVVAAAHVVGQVLNGSRAARLLEQHVLDPSLPGLDDLFEALTAVGEPDAGDTPYEAEVRRAVGRVVTDGLMGLAGSAPMPQVRAVAARHLGMVKVRAQNRAGLDDAATAHFALLVRDIQRFEDRPFDAWSPTSAPQAPPGAPIGSPAMDWTGDWSDPAGSLLRRAGLFVGPGLAGAGWLDALAPFCAVEARRTMVPGAGSGSGSDPIAIGPWYSR